MIIELGLIAVAFLGRVANGDRTSEQQPFRTCSTQKQVQ